MRVRPLALLGGVFGAAALLAAFVASQLPREGQSSAPGGAAPGVPAVERPTPALVFTPGPNDGALEVRATAGGEPLASAAVRLYLATESDEGPGFLRGPEGRTGADGTLRLPAPAGAYLVAVRAAGLAPGHAAAVLPPNTKLARAEVALAPPVVLAGRVAARDGGAAIPARLVALPAAALEASGVAGLAPVEERVEATAGADGAFRLAGLAPGAFALRLEAAGYHERLVPRVLVPRAAPVALRLEAAAVLAGLVRQADGKPAAGIPVLARSAGHAAGVQTGYDGRFRLEVPPGRWQVVAGDVGRRTAALAGPFTLGPGETAGAVALGLEAGATIAGVAVAEDGTPVPGASVRFQAHETGAPIARALAGADGRFTSGPLPAAPLDVEASAPGRGPAREVGLAPPAGGTLPVRLVLAARGAVEGIAADPAGRPLAGVRVRVLRAGGGLPGSPALAALETRSDFEGRYRLAGVPAGAADLVATQEGAACGDARSVAVPAGGAARLDFAVPGAGELAGRVTASDGAKPPLGTEVVVEPLRSGPRQAARVAADASGNFQLALPEGDYRAHAVADVTAGPGSRELSAGVRVEAGRGAVLRLALAPAAAADGPEVLVLEPGGAPSPGAEVAIGRPDDARPALAAAAGEDGRLALARDMGPSGRPVRIDARSGGRAGTWTGTLPASGVVVVALSPGGAVEGRLTAGARPPRAFTVEVDAGEGAPRRVDVHRFSGDRFALRDLPPGPVRLAVRTEDGRRGAADLRVTSGEVQPVVIPLEVPRGKR